MIKTFAYDVEVLPNFFSITIVSVNSYLSIFKDCVNSKGKPIPLIQKYKVEEIKQKLLEVEKKSFYITDTNDSQLLAMIGYLNKLRPYYDENHIPVRSDLFGYNSKRYDKLMVAALLMYAGQCDSTKELIKKLYNLSKKIINLQNDSELFYKDYEISLIKGYKLPYKDIDVMPIFALNKVGTGEDENGNKVYFSKGLKQTSINLQWYELLEYELPPINEKDAKYYTNNPEYGHSSIDELNRIVKTWDRYILEEYIDSMMYYNLNDVFIVCEIIRLYIDEIKLRYSISKSYKVDVLNSSRSDIANKLFEKFYSEFSGLQPHQWKGKKTERTAMSLKKVIHPNIHFQTPILNELLNEMKRITLYSTGKKALKDVAENNSNFKLIKTTTDSGYFEIKLNNLVYTIATGGLHSQDMPRELKSKIVYSSTGELVQSIEDIPDSSNLWEQITDDSFIYTHYDISSYYPSLMSVYKIAPEHLIRSVFVKLITWLKDTRIEAKHAKGDINGIPHDLVALVLKIVINSIYGKLGSKYGDLYDRLAVLKVTINGQLFILMLCEQLELNNIEVVSANTDGIVVKLYKKHLNDFNRITKEWETYTGLSADSENYLYYINSDINNYLIQETNGKISYKGALNPKMYAIDLQKGYDMPIVAEAVSNFFLYNKPILDTLRESTSILDFCKTQNVNRKYKLEFSKGATTESVQNKTRFYVSTNGGYLDKVDTNTNSRSSLCAGHKVTILNSLDDTPISERNIDYTYYFREARKIIDPIKLGINPKQKGNARHKIKSGKQVIEQLTGMYNTLFDDLEED